MGVLSVGTSPIFELSPDQRRELHEAATAWRDDGSRMSLEEAELFALYAMGRLTPWQYLTSGRSEGLVRGLLLASGSVRL